MRSHLLLVGPLVLFGLGAIFGIQGVRFVRAGRGTVGPLVAGSVVVVLALAVAWSFPTLGVVRLLDPDFTAARQTMELVVSIGLMAILAALLEVPVRLGRRWWTWAAWAAGVLLLLASLPLFMSSDPETQFTMVIVLLALPPALLIVPGVALMPFALSGSWASKPAASRRATATIPIVAILVFCGALSYSIAATEAATYTSWSLSAEPSDPQAEYTLVAPFFASPFDFDAQLLQDAKSSVHVDGGAARMVWQNGSIEILAHGPFSMSGRAAHGQLDFASRANVTLIGSPGLHVNVALAMHSGAAQCNSYVNARGTVTANAPLSINTYAEWGDLRLPRTPCT